MLAVANWKNHMDNLIHMGEEISGWICKLLQLTGDVTIVWVYLTCSEACVGLVRHVLVVAVVQTTYRLSAIIRHHGQSPETGHYTAVSRQADHWVCCSDMNVSHISETEALAGSSDVYLCMYQRSGACMLVTVLEQ